MGYKTNFFLLRGESGQSTVEYILLMAVVLTFMTAIWNSRLYKDFMGEDSEFFNGIAKKIEVNYQFSATVPIGTETPDVPTLNHPSFSDSGNSRFFTHDDTKYPLDN